MTATPAPALTAAEQEVVDRFDAAPYPVEVAEAALVETVARAIWEESNPGASPWHEVSEFSQRPFRRLAAAAIAAYRAAQDGAAEEAVRRAQDGEQSVDLTPGVVWTDAQLAVVLDLAARVNKAEAAARRVEVLAAEFDTATIPPPINDFDRGLVTGYARAAARIRATLAAQAGDER